MILSGLCEAFLTGKVQATEAVTGLSWVQFVSLNFRDESGRFEFFEWGGEMRSGRTRGEMGDWRSVCVHVKLSCFIILVMK